MDRNTVIGFILIGVLLIGMFYINSRGRLAYEAEQKRIADSITATKPKADTATAKIDSLRSDTTQVTARTSSFSSAGNREELVSLENDLMKVSFTTRGAQPREVLLKKFRKADGSPLVLQSGTFNRLSYTVNTGQNETAETSDLLFLASPVTDNTDKSKTIRFSISDSTGRMIVHEYTIKPDDYMLSMKIDMRGADRLVTNRKLNLLWQTEAGQVEHNNQYELTQTHICYVKGGDFDFEYAGSGDEKKFSKPVDWVSIKQQFFASALIAKTKMQDASTKWTVPADTNQHYLLRAVTTGRVDVPGNDVSIPFELYYGPSDYNILKKYHNQLENIVPYGSGVFAFVKYINRHFLLPVFDYLRSHIASMGIVILLLTLLIRLITSPILYKSYLSGAKMKVLKPEVDALKEKYKDDQQAFGMEQMKLWRSAGVNPLGGCLPALLQIPIFMSLYYFFQSNIDLRDKSFLWAKDLSAYDTIAKLPFHIPFYGDHVSLFTLTAVVTSLLISIYSMSNMQDNSNPLMKYMPYIFPVVLLGVFNNLPSALTWYYTVSNFITLVLQFVIQTYIIDHDKILAKIEENKKRPVKKSKMQERIEAMQETQKKMQELKNKSSKK